MKYTEGPRHMVLEKKHRGNRKAARMESVAMELGRMLKAAERSGDVEVKEPEVDVLNNN